jgi:hypothetical protein
MGCQEKRQLFFADHNIDPWTGEKTETVFVRAIVSSLLSPFKNEQISSNRKYNVCVLVLDGKAKAKRYVLKSLKTPDFFEAMYSKAASNLISYEQVTNYNNIKMFRLHCGRIEVYQPF